MRPWTNRLRARVPRGSLPDYPAMDIGSSGMARHSRCRGIRMHRLSIVALIVLVAGCAGRGGRPVPPLAGPSSAPVMETPARVSLIAAPVEGDWNALGGEATGLLSQYLRINTTNPPGNEIAAARWLAAVLRREGIGGPTVRRGSGGRSQTCDQAAH